MLAGFNGISFLAENADCHDWNTLQIVIANATTNHNN